MKDIKNRKEFEQELRAHLEQSFDKIVQNKRVLTSLESKEVTHS